MNEEDTYDDEELAQARVLAGVLEESLPGASVLDVALRDPDGLTLQVDDVLDAAGMITGSRLPALAEARVDAVFQLLQLRVQSRRRHARRRFVILASGGSLAAAAVLLLALWSTAARVARAPSASVAAGPAEVAKPDDAPTVAALESARAELDIAQLGWLNDPKPEAAATLERELRKYRSAHFEMLRRRYAP